MSKKELSDKELEQIAVKNAIENFKKNKENKQQESDSSSNKPNIGNDMVRDDNESQVPKMPNMSPNLEDYGKMVSQETDPDLIVEYEIVKLPSRGLFYSNGLSELKVEYLTAKDEDILTTPSLIKSGEALDKIFRRKIKNSNVNPDELLIGDQNAVALFLRASSYGHDYNVQVTDPRSGDDFEYTVDLRKIGYKEIKEKPDENGLFTFFLPMRQKHVKFRMLTAKDSKKIVNDVDRMKEAGYTDIDEYGTMKLKAHVVDIEGKTDRGYINRFIDAMPAGDALKLRRKILEITPDLDLMYEFETKDGYKFKAPLVMGIDFFFPSL
jgi:hypothetical protein